MPERARAWNVVRGGPAPAGIPLHHIGRRADDTYVLFDGQTPRWAVTIDWGESASMPFHGELVWPEAGVAVIGGGAAAYLLDLETANIRLRIPLQSYFGYLVLDRDGARDQTLFLLGCEEVVALRRSLELRWHARELAVDGITFGRIEGSRLWVQAEMDPPGGWFEVEMDLATGKELSRRPAFSDGYLKPGS